MYKTMKLVATPLRFFVAAMLVLASVVVFLAWKSALPPEVTAKLIYVALGALIFVLLLVCFLVIFCPKKLTFDQEGHLAILRENLGDHEFPKAYRPGELPAVEPRILLKESSESKKLKGGVP